MRRAVALLLLAGALVAPASSTAAPFPDTEFENQCQYFDPYWRPVPIVFGGQLKDGSGTELTPGAQLSVGDTVKLEGGTVSAILPSWMTTFAYESGMIPLGDGEIPVKAYLALEATNTAEGVHAPIELNTYARTFVVLGPGGIVDEERSSVMVDKAPLPTQTWTATGGDVQVRQGLAESMPPLPIGRNGALVNIRGSLFVDAALTFPSGEQFHLYMDCLQGQQLEEGSGHTDVIPAPLATIPVPGFQGEVGGTPLTGPVDAQLQYGGPLERVDSGSDTSLVGAALRVRLTDAQRQAWLGGAATAQITGMIDLVGARSVQGTRTATVESTVAVPANGPATLTLPLADSLWTAATADGINIRGERTVVLDALVNGVPRRLTLTRISATDPYPFAQFLRPGPPPTVPDPTPDPDPDPVETPQPVPTVAPSVTPAPTVIPEKKAGITKVSSKALKVKSNRVTAQVSCSGESTCTGTVTLRTTAKVKKKYVTLTKSVKYTVATGKKVTVRLALSSAGKKYLSGKRRVSVVLDVKPKSGKAVAKKLTLTR
jgi:hypothetical protein